MSRRNRGRRPNPDFVPAEQAATPASGMKIIIDQSKLTIGDQALIARATLLQGDERKSLELLPDIIDMLDRVVRGGVKHLPAGELMNVINAITEQANRAAKN